MQNFSSPRIHGLRTCFAALALLASAAVFLGGCSSSGGPPPPRATAGRLDLREWDFERDGTVALDGEWNFWWRKLLLPRETEASGPASRHEFPGSWAGRNFEGKPLPAEGFATFQLDIDLPQMDGERTLAVHILYYAAFDLWAGDILIHRSGSIGETATATVPGMRTAVVPIPVSQRELRLTLRMANFEFFRAGPVASIVFGTADAVHQERDWLVAAQSAVTGSLLIIGAYQFCLYWLWRGERAALYLSLVCLAFGLWSTTVGVALCSIVSPSVTWAAATRARSATLALATYWSGAILWTLYPLEYPVAMRRLAAVIFGVSCAVSLAVSVHAFSPLMPAMLLSMVAFMAYHTWVAVAAVRHERGDAWLLLLGTAAAHLGTVRAFVFLSGNRFVEVYGYALLPMVLAQALIVSRKFAAAMRSAAAARFQEEQAMVAGTLAKISRELMAAVDSPLLLDRLCELTAEALGCDVSYVWRLDAERGVYFPVSHHGDGDERWEAMRLLTIPKQRADRYGGWLDDDAFPALTGGADAGFDASQALASQQSGIGQSLYIPLHHGDQVRALLQAGYRDAIPELGTHRRRIAAGIARIAPLALATSRLVEELAGANRIKEHFVATLSHELRNPIMAIGGQTALLLHGVQGALTEKQTAALEMIRDYNAELQSLIGATLDLSRLEPERIHIDKQPLDIAKLLRDVFEECTAGVRGRPVEYRISVAEDLQTIESDPLKLRIIVRNLLTNAIKFTERGTVTLSAERTGAHHGEIIVEVADTGIGIPESARPSLFQPFEQAHGAESRRRGGAGLGLYLVRRLVEVLHGDVEIDSQAGKGTTVRVHLP